MFPFPDDFSPLQKDAIADPRAFSDQAPVNLKPSTHTLFYHFW